MKSKANAKIKPGEHTSLERTALFAAALADTTRLRLLSLILHTPDICVCDLEAVTKLPQTKISKHLAVLRNTGLVRARREGTWIHYSVPENANSLQRGLIQFVRAAHESVPELQRDLNRLKTTAFCGPKPLVLIDL